MYPDDHSPFFGQIEDRILQRAIFNNMFKVHTHPGAAILTSNPVEHAPLPSQPYLPLNDLSLPSPPPQAPAFAHRAKSTDFLLVETPLHRVMDNQTVGPGLQCFTLREMPSIYLSGQMEPLMEVFCPDSQRLRDFVAAYIRVGIVARFFERKSFEMAEGDGLTKAKRDVPTMGENIGFTDFVHVFEPVAHVIARDDRELNNLVHEHLKAVATEQQSAYWTMEPMKAKHALDDALRRISPEDVGITT